MIPAFLNKEDLHRKTASTCTGKPEAEITKHERSSAKAANFGSVYGGTEHALQGTFKKDGIRRSLDECKVIVEAVKTTYPGIARYQIDAVILARETGYAETIYGFKRLLSAINSGNRGDRQSDERRSQNTPIQGSAADIMKKAQSALYEKIGIDTAFFNLWDRLGSAEAFTFLEGAVWDGFDDRTKALLFEEPFMRHGRTDMIAQIHDEIISQLDDDTELVKKYALWQKNAMEIPPLKDFPIPLEAEASIAYSWGNKKSLEAWLEEREGAS